MRWVADLVPSIDNCCQSCFREQVENNMTLTLSRHAYFLRTLRHFGDGYATRAMVKYLL